MRYLLLVLFLATVGCNTTPEQWQQASRSWNGSAAGGQQQPQRSAQGENCVLMDVGGGIMDFRCQ